MHSDSTNTAIPAQEPLAPSQYRRRAEAPDPSPREQILAAPAADRHKLVSAYLTRAANRFLGHAPSHAFPADVPLGDFGIDSLASIQLRSRIETDLGAALAVRTLLTGTLHSLATEIAAKLAAPG